MLPFGATPNPFVSGGLVLMLTGSVLALARNIPGKILDSVRSQSMVSVSIEESDPLFDWITLWLADHPYSKRTRRIRAKTKDVTFEKGRPNPLPRILYSPDKGEHFFFYQGRFIWLSRARAGESGSGKPAPPQDNPSSNPFKRGEPEFYTFRTFGRSQEKVRSLINEVLKHTEKERQEKIQIYTSNNCWWEKLFSCETRTLESVFLEGDKKEDLVKDMRKFLTEKPWYNKRGIPYSRKYLFHGPPGNGKSSIIAALAGELGLNLYVLNLSGGGIDDSGLASLVRGVRPKSLLLLEDVDAVVPSRTNIATEDTLDEDDDESTPAVDGAERTTKQRGVTLSGLLNTLDGVLTPEGLMVVMTTNRPEVLDPALVRPGRVDKKVVFPFATTDQIRQSFLWFYPEKIEQADEFVAKFEGGSFSMATVQQELMKMKEMN